MNKENKRKSLFFTLSATFLLIILALLCFVPTSLVVYASTEDDVSTYADVNVDDISTRFEIYKSNDVINNIPSGVTYYDASLSNDSNNNTLGNDYWSWSAGANVMNNDINKVVFTLNLKYTGSLAPLPLGICLYRANKDTNTSSCLLELQSVRGSSMEYIYIKQHSFGSETIGYPVDDNFKWESSSVAGGFTGLGYRIQSLGDSCPFYGVTNKQLHIIVDTEYLTDTYFLSFYINNGDQVYRVDSKIVSVYDIVSQMKDRDELSYLNEENQARANELLTDGTIRKIQVSWLERIGNTPFARKRYDWVEIPVTTDVISPADVIDKLDIDTFAVGQSSCQYFKEDTNTGIFNAYYLKNVWLSSKDSNGHSMNLFLDINVSYQDYYRPFVQDGIFTEGMYEWFWSKMIVDYPEISGIDDADLYGYFGYTSVPYTYTLNQLVYEMFDGSPNMNGVVQYFSYRDDLSYDSYMKLLDDYNYGWLSKAWNSVVGFIAGSKYPADHYFFYVNGEKDNAFIGENGADDIYDNSGAFSNGVENVVEDITNGLEIIFDNPLSRYLALGIGIFIVTWFMMFFFTSFFKVKKARQEYKNARRRRKGKG